MDPLRLDLPDALHGPRVTLRPYTEADAPAVLASVIAGLACALVLPSAVGTAIDLSAFTGTSVPIRFQADALALGLPAAVIVLLALAVLAVEARAARRRDVSGLLRAH